MAGKLIVLIATALVCGSPLAANAEDKPANDAPAVSADDLTREQFQAMAPDAVIEINGERLVPVR